MEHNKNGFGLRLRDLRLKRNFTVAKLAEDLEISSSYIGLLERSERTPSFELLKKICTRFNVSLDYLVFGNDVLKPSGTKQIVIDEAAIKAFYSGQDWNNADMETVFGWSVGNSVKVHGFSVDELTRLFAIINYAAWKMKMDKI